MAEEGGHLLYKIISSFRDNTRGRGWKRISVRIKAMAPQDPRTTQRDKVAKMSEKLVENLYNRLN